MSTAVMNTTSMFDFTNFNLPLSEIVNESKRNPWRDDMNSPTPTLSDTSSIMSTISDDGSNLTINSQGASSAYSYATTESIVATLLGNHRKLNRSQSEPMTGKNKQQAIIPGNGGNFISQTSRYKTELCHPFEENGSCKYGDKCQFAHGVHEIRDLARHPKYKTELCRTFHAEGYCPYGTRCHFIHEEPRSIITKPIIHPVGVGLHPKQLLCNSVKDLTSLSSPTNLNSPSLFTANTAFSFSAPLVHLSPMSTPPQSPSPTESRLAVFDQISSPILPLSRQFSGLTA